MAKKSNRPPVEPVASDVIEQIGRDDVPPLPMEANPAAAVEKPVDEPVATDGAEQGDEDSDPDPVHTLMLELPMAEHAVGYQQRHLNRPLPATVAETYQRLALGLRSTGAKLDDGRAVETVEHAIIYVGQQLRAQIVPV